MKSNSSTPEVRPWTSELDPQNGLVHSRGDALLCATPFWGALFAYLRISIFKNFLKCDFFH